MNDDELKRLWQQQPVSVAAPALDVVKAEALRLDGRVRVRNAVEYAACVLVFGVFSFYLFVFTSPLMRLGSALTLVAIVFVAWQLHRRASSQALPQAAGEQAWLPFQRAQLVRQRDALRSVWRWYLAPFLPGLVVFRWGVERDLPAAAAIVPGLWANAIIALILVGVLALNLYGAHRLQQRIDALDRLAG